MAFPFCTMVGSYARNQNLSLNDYQTDAGRIMRRAEAVFVGMRIEISQDEVIGDVARGGREVAALPQAPPPLALVDVLELLLDLV